MLVTHQLQYLKDVKHAVLMNMGRIEAKGSFNVLKRSNKHSLLGLTNNDEQNIDKTEENVDSINVYIYTYIAIYFI